MKNSRQRSLLYIVIAAALGGFLFGFDSGVISGCEQAIQTEFGLSGFWHGLIVSGALIGTVIGVFTVGAPSDRWGRRRASPALHAPPPPTACGADPSVRRYPLR